jgi:hypothetical protein
MNENFFQHEENLRKIFIFHCQHSIYVDDAITQTICMFLDKPINVTLGVHGASFYSNSIIFPYIYLDEKQRMVLYEFISSISRDTMSKGFYRISNGFVTMTSESGKKLDSHIVWRVVFTCIKNNTTHKKVHRMLASVTLQRVLCRINMSKEDADYATSLIDEMFASGDIVQCSDVPGFLEDM